MVRQERLRGRSAAIVLVLALLSLSSGAATVTGTAAHAQAPEPPNFIVVVTDDQRAESMRVMKKTRDWFRSLGARFPNAYATTPLCCPSRASIFTGRYAHNHGVETNRDAAAFDDSTTIQAYLRNMGYATGIFGKYLNGRKENPGHFDQWATAPSGSRYRGITWNVNGTSTYVERYSTHFIEEKSLEFIDGTEAADERPWLMFVTPQAPHAPYTSAARYRTRNFSWQPDPSVNETDVSDKPRYVRQLPIRKFEGVKRLRTRQLRTLLSVDDLVAALFDRLLVRDELDHTVVFYLSDNGFMWGDHRMSYAGTGKNTPYTGSVRIPFLYLGPGQPTGIDDRLVANIDIAPTIYDLAGATTRTGPPFDGRSLTDEWDRELLLLEWWEGRFDTAIPPWRGLRSTTMSYVEYQLPDGSTTREFYDLVADPYELDNLLGDGDPSNDPDTTELKRSLNRYSTCSGASCP